MLHYISTNKYYGKMYFSTKSFINYLAKKYYYFVLTVNNHKIFKCISVYILPVAYNLYNTIEYLISTDINQIKRFIEEYF